MGYGAGSRAAHALDEGATGVDDLVVSGLTAQLQGGFNCLVQAGRTAGVAAGFQAAHRIDRQAAVQADHGRGGGFGDLGAMLSLPTLGQFPALTGFCITGGFKR